MLSPLLRNGQASGVTQGKAITRRNYERRVLYKTKIVRLNKSLNIKQLLKYQINVTYNSAPKLAKEKLFLNYQALSKKSSFEKE